MVTTDVRTFSAKLNPIVLLVYGSYFSYKVWDVSLSCSAHEQRGPVLLLQHPFRTAAGPFRVISKQNSYLEHISEFKLSNIINILEASVNAKLSLCARHDDVWWSGLSGPCILNLGAREM